MAVKDERDYYMKRLSALELERSSFITHYRELSDHIDPRRGRFFVSDRNRGERKHQSIINSRGTQALRTAQSGLFAGIMSPSRQWFKFETMDQDMMRSSAVKQWLYKVETLARTIFLESNLYNMAPVMLGELLQFGTGAMSHLDDFNSVARFYTHTAGSYMIGQNDKCEIDTFCLQRERTVKQIVEEFGIENVSIAVKDQYDKGNYDSWYPIVQIVEPNPDYDERKLEGRFKAYRSVWFEPGIQNRDKFLRKGGFDEFPFHVPRWGVTGEDIYGTSCPGMLALGDIKGLQIMEKRKAQAVDKLVNPPLKGPPSLRNVPISSLPGGATLYDSDGTKEGLGPIYQVDPRLNEMRMDMQSIESRINEAFFVDLFMAISAMDGVQPRNQLELSQRNEERLLMLGPPLERIQREFLSNLIERTFQQMIRGEILPPPPPELENQPLNIRYISSLAMAQRAAEVSTIERTALFTGQLMQLNPEVMDSFDADEALQQYVQMTGAVPSIIRSAEAVQQIREQRAQAQQAQMAAEMANQGAQALDKGASAAQKMADS
jgi:hypothetical protein